MEPRQESGHGGPSFQVRPEVVTPLLASAPPTAAAYPKQAAQERRLHNSSRRLLSTVTATNSHEVDTRSGRRRRGHAGNHTSGKTLRVAWNTSCDSGKRYDVHYCNAGPQKLISDVDVFV